MTTPTIIQNASNFNASSSSTLTLGTVSGASVGDLIIAWGTCERNTATAVISGGSSSWTTLQNMTNTNHTSGIYWKFLTSGDLSATIVATPSGAVTRRMAGGFIVLSNAGTPSASVRTAVTTAVTSANANNMTPTVADSLLMTLFTSVSVSTPWARTFSAHTSSFVERLQASSSSAASSNPFFALSTKALTGGTTSQTFDAVTISSASEYNALSFVIPPSSNAAPTAGISASKTTGVVPGEVITLTLTGSDDVAVVSDSLVQISGTSAAPSGTGSTRTIVAPSVLGGTTLVYGYTTNDGTLSSVQATVSITVTSAPSVNPTYIQGGSGSLASAASTLTIGTLSGVSVGDLVIAWCTAERASVVPTLSGGSSAWNLLVNLTNTNHATGLYYKRVSAGDTTATIVGNVSSTRRLSGGFVVYRGAVDPVINTKTAVTSATTTATANSMTPTISDSTLLTFYTSVSTSSPFIRTFGSYTAGWTERVQISGSAAALSNPFSTIVEKPLSGGLTSQTFSGATISSASEYNAVSIVVGPGSVNIAPDAYISADKTINVEPGAIVTLTLSDGDDVAVITRTLRQISGITTAVSGSGSTRTLIAPYVVGGTTLQYGYKVNDGSLDSTEATVNIVVLRPTYFTVVVGGATPTLAPIARTFIT